MIEFYVTDYMKSLISRVSSLRNRFSSLGISTLLPPLDTKLTWNYDGTL